MFIERFTFIVMYDTGCTSQAELFNGIRFLRIECVFECVRAWAEQNNKDTEQHHQKKKSQSPDYIVANKLYLVHTYRSYYRGLKMKCNANENKNRNLMHFSKDILRIKRQQQPLLPQQQMLEWDKLASFRIFRFRTYKMGDGIQ